MKIKFYDEMKKSNIITSFIVSWIVGILFLVAYIIAGRFLDYDTKWAVILLIITIASYSITSTIIHFKRGIVLKDD